MAGNKNKKTNSGGGKGKPKPQQPPNSKVSASNADPGFSNHFKINTKVNSHPDGSLTLKGTELVGLTQQTPSGDLVSVLDLAPGQWSGTRAATYARMFESFKIMDCTVTVVPTCPNTTSGLTFIYYDRDPLDAPVGNVLTYSNVSKLMSAQGAVAGPVWKPLSMNFKAGAEERNGYYTQPVMGEGDFRLTQQGLVYVYTTGSPAVTGGGLVKVDYTIRFFTPTSLGTPLISSAQWYNSNFITIGNTSTSTPLAASTFSTVAGGDNTVIYELLIDAPLNVTIGGLGKTIASYVPIFLRYTTGVIGRFFIDAASALSENPDGILYGSPANSAVNTTAWAKVAMGILAVATA